MAEEDAITIEELIKKKAPNLSDKERQKQVEAIEKMFAEGVPLKETLNITPDVLEFLYSQGNRFYLLRKYQEAARFFQMLFLLNPIDARYAFGVAASYQMLKDYDQAISWYIVLMIIDQESPLPPYHASDCFLKKGDKDSALLFLKKTLERIGDKKEYAPLKERASRMMAPLEKEVAK